MYQGGAGRTGYTRVVPGRVHQEQEESRGVPCLHYPVLGVPVPVTAVEQCLGRTAWAQTAREAWVRRVRGKPGPGLSAFFEGCQREAWVRERGERTKIG